MIQKINKELAILVMGRGAQILIMLFAIKLSTALLNPSEMGNLYLILTIYSFFGFFFMNPIGQYVNRKTHEWHQNGVLLNKLFNYNYYILSASILSFFVVVILYSFGIANSMNYTLLIIFIPLYVFFNTWNQTIIPMINMLEYRTAFTVLTILTLLLALFTSYFMVDKFEKNGLLWFSGQIVGLGMMAIIAFVFFMKKVNNTFSISVAHSSVTKTNLKHIVSFALPLSIAVLFLWMQNQSYRLIIEKYIGAEFLGYFGVGMAIAIAISSSFETIVMQFLYPKIYKQMNDEVQFKIIFSNIINLILPIYFFLAIFVSFTAMYLTIILVDIKYTSSFIFVIFGIWVEFFRMSSNLISTIAHSKMQTKTLIIPYAIGGIFVAVGTYLVSQNQHYALLIPIVLIVGGFLTFWQMFRKMNTLINFDLKIENFIHILLYSFAFGIVTLLYDYSISFCASIAIVLVFGLYFLFVLYRFIKLQGVMI